MIRKGAWVHLNSGSPVLWVCDIGSNDIGSYDLYVEWINDEGVVDVMSAPVQCFYLSSERTPTYIGD